MHCYVINMERSGDRRAHIVAELNRTGIDYEMVTAIDGQELDLVMDADIDPSFLTFNFPAGSAGCAFSHLSVYRKIVEAELSEALVLEDDVVVTVKDLGKLAEAVAENLEGAEIALLNFDSAEPCRLSTEGAINLPFGRTLALPIDVAQPRSGAAYIITGEACQRMLGGAIPIRALADSWWHFYRNGLVDRIRCVVPLSVGKSPDFASSIGTYRLGEGLGARLAGSLARTRVPGIGRAIAFRRQRIFHKWGRFEMVAAPFVDKPSRLDGRH